MPNTWTTDIVYSVFLLAVPSQDVFLLPHIPWIGQRVVYFLYITLWSYLSQPLFVLMIVYSVRAIYSAQNVRCRKYNNGSKNRLRLVAVHFTPKMSIFNFDFPPLSLTHTHTHTHTHTSAEGNSRRGWETGSNKIREDIWSLTEGLQWLIKEPQFSIKLSLRAYQDIVYANLIT